MNDPLEDPRNWIPMISLMHCMVIVHDVLDMDGAQYSDAAHKAESEVEERFGEIVADQISDQAWEEAKAMANRPPFSWITKEDLVRNQ